MVAATCSPSYSKRLRQENRLNLGGGGCKTGIHYVGQAALGTPNLVIHPRPGLPKCWNYRRTVPTLRLPPKEI
ncbi:hypothetical protein AAY473_029782 [Plecturocebus cupreus]